MGYGNGDNIGDGTDEMGDFLKTVDLGTGFNATGITSGCKNYHNCVYDGNVPDLNALKCFGWNSE